MNGSFNGMISRQKQFLLQADDNNGKTLYINTETLLNF